MNILEQILEEIDQKIEKAKELMVSCPCDRLDVIANETAEAFIEAYKECQEIICSHMEDEPVSNTDKLDNGWIPAEIPPKTNDYILLSFSNFSLPLVGRYGADETGGHFIWENVTEMIRVSVTIYT